MVAQSERLLGRIALAAQTPEYPEAVEHFSQAIRKATPLMTARSKSVQQAAREVLLDAHLGTALAIARGTWQQKSRVIPKWIARSEALAADLKPESLNKDDFELQLCRRGSSGCWYCGRASMRRSLIQCDAVKSTGK